MVVDGWQMGCDVGLNERVTVVVMSHEDVHGGLKTGVLGLKSEPRDKKRTKNQLNPDIKKRDVPAARDAPAIAAPAAVSVVVKRVEYN